MMDSESLLFDGQWLVSWDQLATELSKESRIWLPSLDHCFLLGSSAQEAHISFFTPQERAAENCTNSDAVRLTLSKIHHSASAKKFFRWMRGSFPKTWQTWQVIWQASAFSMKRLCRCWKPVRSLLEEAHFKALEGWDLRSLIWWYKGITIDLQRHITIGTPKNLGWRVSRVSYCKSIPWNSLNHVKQQWSHYLFKLLKCRIKTSSWAI